MSEIKMPACPRVIEIRAAHDSWAVFFDARTAYVRALFAEGHGGCMSSESGWVEVPVREQVLRIGYRIDETYIELVQTGEKIVNRRPAV
jgi:hypothetical protein